MIRPALVAAERSREDDRRCEPRRQPEEIADPVNQSVRRCDCSFGVNVAHTQEEPCDRCEREEDVSSDSGPRTCHRLVEDERERTDAGGSRKEGDVHQPSEVTQRVLAYCVAVVELWVECVEERNQNHAKQRPGNRNTSPQMSLLGRSAKHPGECIATWVDGYPDLGNDSGRC